MKKIIFENSFKKNYLNRVKDNSFLKESMQNAVRIFLEDPYDPVLNNHELRGNLKGKRAFSILDDLRIVYIETNDYYIFLDIGSHKEVYG